MVRAVRTAIAVFAGLVTLLGAVSGYAAPAYAPWEAVSKPQGVEQVAHVVPVRGGGFRGGGYRGGGYSRGYSGRSYSRPAQPRRPPTVRPPSIRPPSVRPAPKLAPRLAPGAAPRISRPQLKPSLSPNLGRLPGRTSPRLIAPRIQPRPGPSGLRSATRGASSLRKSGISSRLAARPRVGAGIRSGASQSKLGSRSQDSRRRNVSLGHKPANQNNPQAGVGIMRSSSRTRDAGSHFHLMVMSRSAIVGRFSGRPASGITGSVGTKAVTRLRTDSRVAITHRKLYERVAQAKSLRANDLTRQVIAQKVVNARARYQKLLKNNIGYNVSPKSWDSHPTIGKKGTYVTDKEAIESAIGKIRITGGHATISKQESAKVETALGLKPGTLSQGFKIREINGISSRDPRKPRDGNRYFQGHSNHLPGGGPEMVIKSIRTKDGDGVRTILQVEVQ